MDIVYRELLLVEEDLDSEFIQVGKEIVKKCGGVPLAITTVGGVLFDKREINTWRAIRESNLWNVGGIKESVCIIEIELLSLARSSEAMLYILLYISKRL